MALTTPDTTFGAKTDIKFRLRGEPDIKFRLRGEPENVAMARELTDVTLSGWALPYLVPDTKLVVDELFTNALRAAPHVDLFLCIAREEETICLGVWDPNPLMPVMGCCDPSDESGRGLHIVAALADTHGSYPVDNPQGKIVWARMTI